MPNLLTHLKTDNNEKLTINSIHYIVGYATTDGVWKGYDESIDEYYDGLTIAYKVPLRGAPEVTLNIQGAGETWLGAEKIFIAGGTPLTYENDAGVIILVYRSTSNLKGWHYVGYKQETLDVTNKTLENTTDLAYVVTTLRAEGRWNHTISPGYVGLPTKAYVDKLQIEMLDWTV